MPVRINSIEGDSRVTVATIDIDLDGFGYESFTGSAIRNFEDKPNKDVGELLALSRAFGKLSKRLNNLAWGEIKQQENVRYERRKREAQKALESSKKKGKSSGRKPNRTRV